MLEAEQFSKFQIRVPVLVFTVSYAQQNRKRCHIVIAKARRSSIIAVLFLAHHSNCWMAEGQNTFIFSV